jgi:hypothetical protein
VPKHLRRSRAAAARALLFASLVLFAALPSFARAPAEAVKARPATPASYRERVRGARVRLEWLATHFDGTDGESSKEDLEAAGGTLEKVRALLPPKERVEWGGRAIEVDNAWLHEALEGIDPEGAEDEKSAEECRAAAGRLRALEARLEEPEGAGADLDRDAERGRLNAILRGPEFERESAERGNSLQRLLEEIADWIINLLPKGTRVTPGASPRATTLTQFLVFGLCLAVLVYVARRVWLRRGLKLKSLGLKRGARVVLGERLEADQTASDLLDEAERLARAGELRGAIRKAYVALLCELGDRGVVRLAQHKTNRDYLNAVRRAARPALYTEMLPLTSDFELHWYGLRAATASDWENFKTRCRKAIKESGV